MSLSPTQVDSLVVGQRYLIVHRIGAQRQDRRSVMDFLGVSQTGELQFNARPVAGTQAMTRAMISSIQRVEKSTPIVLNEIVR